MCRLSIDRVALRKSLGTERSTVAPLGIRPALGMFTVTLEPSAAGRAEAADDQVALRDRVDVAVGTAQRCHHQAAAAQALGVADRGNRDVDGLARLRERRQIGVHRHRGDVLELQADVPGGIVTPNCVSMLMMLCTVNGVCVVWSPVPLRPTTSP